MRLTVLKVTSSLQRTSIGRPVTPDGYAKPAVTNMHENISANTAAKAATRLIAVDGPQSNGNDVENKTGRANAVSAPRGLLRSGKQCASISGSATCATRRPQLNTLAANVRRSPG